MSSKLASHTNIYSLFDYNTGLEKREFIYFSCRLFILLTLLLNFLAPTKALGGEPDSRESAGDAQVDHRWQLDRFQAEHIAEPNQQEGPFKDHQVWFFYVKLQFLCSKILV